MFKTVEEVKEVRNLIKIQCEKREDLKKRAQSACRTENTAIEVKNLMNGWNIRLDIAEDKICDWKSDLRKLPLSVLRDKVLNLMKETEDEPEYRAKSFNLCLNGVLGDNGEMVKGYYVRR